MKAASSSHAGFELRALTDTARMLAGAHDADFLLTDLLRTTMGKLAAPRGAIIMHQSKKSQYAIAAVKGNIKVAVGAPITLKIASANEPAATLAAPEEVTCEPTLFPDGAPALLVNLKTNNAHLGYLALGKFPSQPAFNKREHAFLESMCAMYATALTNARMVSQLRATNRKLDRSLHQQQTLFNFRTTVSGLHQPEQIARALTFTVLGQFMTRTFFLAVERDSSVQLIAQSGLSEAGSVAKLQPLFASPQPFIRVDESLREVYPFLAKNSISHCIPFAFDEIRRAFIGLGPPGNGRPYDEASVSFIQSLANVALLELQKNRLLQERIEKERMQEELSIARRIQQRLFPGRIPTPAGYDIAARNQPSAEVGGDYYDCIECDGRLIFAIADVAGKGTAAALLMANLQSLLRFICASPFEFVSATAQISAILYQNTLPEKFITFFWAAINPQTGGVEFVNAGHNPPLLFQSDGGAGSPQALSCGGVVLGAFREAAPYEVGNVDLAAGQVLVCYTDGITEATNAKSKQAYGTERLIACVQRHKNKSAEKIVQAVMDDVAAFTDGARGDDQTLMIIKRC